MPTSELLCSMRYRRYLIDSIGFLNRLMYSNWVFLMSTWLSWLSCRYRIFICGNMLNFRGTSARKLLDRSSFISPVHFEIVPSYVCLMLVPARISSFRDTGSLINELICSYYYWAFFFFIFATLTYFIIYLKLYPQSMHLLHIHWLICWRSLFIPNSLILVITNQCLNLYHSDIYLIFSWHSRP